MAHERLRPQFLFDEEKIKQLKQIAPECFEDGKINFETLRQNLGDWAQDEEDKDLEHFGLFWPGKREARRAASIPSQGTLEPVYGEGLKADGTPDTDGVNDSKNIFIEGENLEVLKILQKSYAGKIKMIYIDPPYNTGNDFIYDDDFTEPLQEYLRRTGQVDEEGKPLTTNKRADGRFHSKWLSMIYPRLRLARQLLKDDGVIFISIDDNEVHNLRALMSEVFGEENFVTTIIWQKVYAPKNTAKHFSEDHDYIVVYAKNIETWQVGYLPRTETQDSLYKNPDNDPRGPWMSDNLTARNYYSEGQYEVKGPTGNVFKPGKGRYWRQSHQNFLKLVDDNRVWWGKNKDSMPRLKRFLSEVSEGRVPQTLWTYKDVGHTQEAKKELLQYVTFENTENVLNSVKPTRLIEKIIQIGVGKDDDEIILDFFGGSGSTGHAVLKKTLEDGLNRKFILVQFPEPLNKEEKEAQSIADLGKSRLRNYSREIKGKAKDCGFQMLKLTSSNFKKWSNYEGVSVSDLETSFDLFNSEPLISGWTEKELLTEIMLIEGFTLSSVINIENDYKGNKIFSIHDDFCEHSLLVCADMEIKKETVSQLDLKGNDIFICLDSAIDNVDKLRLSDKGLIKTI